MGLIHLGVAIMVMVIVAASAMGFVSNALQLMIARNDVALYMSNDIAVRGVLANTASAARRTSIFLTNLHAGINVQTNVRDSGPVLRMDFEGGPQSEGAATAWATIYRLGTNQLIYYNGGTARSWVIADNCTSLTFRRSGGMLVTEATIDGQNLVWWTEVM